MRALNSVAVCEGGFQALEEVRHYVLAPLATVLEYGLERQGASLERSNGQDIPHSQISQQNWIVGAQPHWSPLRRHFPNHLSSTIPHKHRQPFSNPRAAVATALGLIVQLRR